MWYEFGLIAAGAFLAALWVIGSAGFAFAIVMTGAWIDALFGLFMIAYSVLTCVPASGCR